MERVDPPRQNAAAQYKGRGTYVAMSSEVLQELDLTQGALGQDLLAKNIGNLLDRDTLVCVVVHRCAALRGQCQ